MNKFIKAAVLSLATAAIVLPTFGTAQAGHHDDAWAAGAVGLVTGALIGTAIATPPRYYGERVYVDPEPEYYEPAPVYRPRPVYRPVYRPVVESYGVEPWTQSWYRYCSQRYRSFDPDSGTFVGYDGRRHFCTAG